MHIDIPNGRDIQDLLTQDLPEGGCHAQVRFQVSKVFHAGLPDPFRLEYRNARFRCRDLHWTRGQLVSPSLGPVRLGKYAGHIISFPDQGLQGRHRKFRGAHKYDPHCASSSGICPLISSSDSSRSITSMYSVPSR